MRIIDRYIIKEVTIPIIFCLYMLIFLFIMVDVFDNLYELINNKTALKEVVLYYIYLTPFAIVQTISWATFLGIVYLFTMFARRGELTAMKASGLKITQIVSPLLFLGLIIGVITFLLNDRLVPVTMKRADDIKKNHIEISCPINNNTDIIKNATLLSRHRQYFIKEYDHEHKTMKDIRIHVLDKKSNRVLYKIAAQKGSWIDHKWVFTDVSLYHLDNRGRIIGAPEIFDRKYFPELDETPDDFVASSAQKEFMNSKHLEQLIKKLRENNLNTIYELTSLHHKRAFPWQSFVILLIVIPILGRTGNVRSNMGKNIFLCIIIVIIYHLFSAIALALGTKGLLFPFLSAWMGNLVFTTAGIFLLDSANY